MKRGAGALALLACACAAEPVSRGEVTQATWERARAALSSARARAPHDPYVDNVRVALRDPRTGQVFSGRGAIAVEPGRALRLILLGPAGTTALDVWATRDRFRFAIPPANVIRRGGEESPSELPIGFFRSWFLRRYEGRLLTIAGDALVLRDGAATLRVYGLLDTTAPVKVSWREGSSIQELEVADRGAPPPVGERVRYRAVATGLEVEVTVESVSDAPADPSAFVDPDAAGGSP